MMAYQTVCYYDLKQVGVCDLQKSYNGLSANISHQVGLYNVNVVLHVSRYMYNR